MENKHPVAFFEIVSSDVPKVQAFYRDLFGWSIDNDEEGYGLVDTGVGAVGGGIGPSTTPGDTGVKVYVKTDALEDTVARARELGASVYLEPMDLPGGYGRIAVVSDPDGNPLGLWS